MQSAALQAGQPAQSRRGLNFAVQACHGKWAVSPLVVGSAKSSQNGQRGGRQPACAGCAQLQRVLAETQSQLQATTSELQAGQAREAKLQAQVAQLQQALFGRKSEATPAAADEPAGADTVPAESGDEESSGPDAPASEASVARRRRHACRVASCARCWSGWTCPPGSAAVPSAARPTCSAGTRSVVTRPSAPRLLIIIPARSASRSQSDKVLSVRKALGAHILASIPSGRRQPLAATYANLSRLDLISIVLPLHSANGP